MGAVFALFAGWFYWTPKIFGLNFDWFFSKVHFWILFIGVNFMGRMFFDNSLAHSSAHKPVGTPTEGKRFSHLSSGGSPSEDPNFVVFFENVKSSKKEIYKCLRRKAGVYLIINNITKDVYVGSSVNLSKRMVCHFYHANSTKDTKIVITRAMKKYKLENFSLAILEFCAPYISICLELEQKWIEYYKPRYNVLTTAGSSSGFRHSMDTINKLKQLLKAENHPKYGSVSSDETRQAIREGVKEFYRTHTHKHKGLKGVLSPQYGIGGQFVFCYSEKGEELTFPSVNGAKQHFKVRWTTIKKNLDTNNWVTLQGEKWVLQSTPRQNT
jgi:group I intron endonuclease